MNTDVVVADVSLAMKWVLDEADSEAAHTLMTHWASQNTRVIAPSWWACEVANVLHKRVRGARPSEERLTLNEALELFDDVIATVIVADDDPAIARRALELASELDQKASYDCQYLALAEQQECEFWTADRRFWNAAGGTHPLLRWVGDVSERSEE